jgi:hypothetical protein
LRRGWRKAAPLLLFASLLPGLSAIDHWGPGADEPSTVAEADDVGHATSHVAHCHYQPSSCSDQPLTPNANAFPGIIELPSPALTNDPLYDSVTLFEEFLAPPPDQPPQSA